MKKLGWTIIAVVLLAAVGIFFYFNKGDLFKKDEVNEKKLYDLSLEEREIITGIKYNKEKFIALLDDLQTIPKEVVAVNAKIIKLSYKLEDNDKVAISDDDLKLLGGIQRLYYSEKLLEENTESEYYERLLKDVREWNEKESYIIDYEIKEPIIITGDEAVINIKYIMNKMSSEDIYQQYILKEYDGKWYIEGWRGISELEYKKNE